MSAQPAAWSSPVTGFVDRHQRALSCRISFAILMALHQLFRGGNAQPFDAGEYWRLASPSVFGREPSFRGYVFPALLLPLHFLCGLMTDPAPLFRLGMSASYGVALPLLVPASFQELFGGKVTFWRRLLPVILLAALFPGLLIYPLSDLPALLLALGALYCTLRGMRQTAAGRFLGMLAAAGVLIGAAYNTRTVYLFVPPGLLVLLALLATHATRIRWLSRWAGIAALGAGLIAVSLPQLLINQRTHGVSSLAVQAQVDNHSLFANQLVWGLTLQRYETTVNPEAPAPSVFYLDPDGEQLFHEVAGQGDLFSLRYYLKVVAKHPVHFLSLYTRHVINGLDVRDGIVYTRKPSPLRTPTALFNFAVLALACWVAWSLRVRSSSQPLPPGVRPAPATWRWSLLILLLPVVTILPGAVETRFFLPLHLLAYCMIAFHFDAQSLRQSARKHGRVLILATVAAAAVFFAVSSSTMAQIRYSWPDVYRHGLPTK
jgi:hypothetical protein